jgi:hypothetical protein
MRPLTAKKSCLRVLPANHPARDSRDSDPSRMPEGGPRSEIQKKFWQGESMVDERIVAILRYWESIIDALLTCFGENIAVVHVILISWALVDFSGRAIRCARARDA